MPQGCATKRFPYFCFASMPTPFLCALPSRGFWVSFSDMTPLESIRLFNGLSAGELNKIRSAIVERSYAPGETIFREGDPGDGIYFVKSGYVEVSAAVGQTQHRQLSRLAPGDLFGEMAVHNNNPQTATTIAGDN